MEIIKITVDIKNEGFNISYPETDASLEYKLLSNYYDAEVETPGLYEYTNISKQLEEFIGTRKEYDEFKINLTNKKKRILLTDRQLIRKAKNIIEIKKFNAILDELDMHIPIYFALLEKLNRDADNDINLYYTLAELNLPTVSQIKKAASDSFKNMTAEEMDMFFKKLSGE